MADEARRGSMLVHEARRRAQAWVEREASGLPGFLGAFATGSVKWSEADAAHPASSDVDVRVVLEGEGGREEEGRRAWKKSLQDGILLEALAVPRASMATAEQVLADPYLSGSLWRPVLLADPAGVLAALAREVGAQFPRPCRVAARRERMRALALQWLARSDSSEIFAEQATCWLFGVSATTLVLLAAGLKSLTVRRRWVASRALLETHGRLDLHEEMLAWQGCADWSVGRARGHLEELAALFDATVPHVDPGFRFAADLRPAARPIAIDGSRELIDAGLHREAVFWLGSTFSRCLQALRPEAPAALHERAEAGLRALLADLGAGTSAGVRTGAQRVREGLARVDAAADAIVAATPEIVECGA